MNVRLLSKILPEWEFTTQGDYLIMSTENETWDTGDDFGRDYLYGEVERALLKDERVYAVSVRSDKSGAYYVEIEPADGFESITGTQRADRSDKLSALLAAAEPLYMEGA